MPSNSRKTGTKRRRVSKAVAKYRKPLPMYRTIAYSFPPTMVFRFPYTTVINLDASAGTVAQAFIRANSIHDPEAAIGGHQPLYHDTFSSVYNHYCVEGSSIKVDFLTPTTNQQAVTCGISTNDDSTMTSGTDGLLARMQMRDCVYTHHEIRGQGPVTLRKNWSKKKYFPPQCSDNGKLSAQFGANPAEGMVFCIWAGAPDVGDNPAPLQAVVKVIYTVRMWELKEKPIDG